jgi:hypothetical protein
MPRRTLDGALEDSVLNEVRETKFIFSLIAAACAHKDAEHRRRCAARMQVHYAQSIV